MTSGVGISFLELAPKEAPCADLREVIGQTCVGFLALARSVDACGPAEGREPKPSEPEVGDVLNPTGSDSRASAFGPVELEDEYEQLARERDFPILPFARDIDRWQRWPPVEIVNALLVGLACLCFAVRTLPNPPILETLTSIETFAGVLFTFDYLLRWYSRGLRWDYLLHKYMIVDFLALFPFLLQPVVPEFRSLSFNFLRLLRTVRLYRLLQPLKFKQFRTTLLGVKSGQSLPKPYQFQLIPRSVPCLRSSSSRPAWCTTQSTT